MEREYVPIPSPPLPTPAPLAVFSYSRLFAPTLRVEVLRSPPHYRQRHFVLWVRESRDYSRKTTGSKNDLHAVEPPYLVPLLPLSSNIIRVIVRNVPVWESYISHIYHMIDCVQHSTSVLIHYLWNPSQWKQYQKINVTIFCSTFSIKAFFKITVEQHIKTSKGLRSN